MTHEEVVELVTAKGGTIVVVASEDNGDPEMAWGDTFFFYDPDGVTVPEKRMPFATIVVNDYPGFDEASDLSRPGVFRVNVSVSRDTFEHHSPDEDTSIDYAALDRVIPHPVYAAQSWLSVLNPGPATEDAVRALLSEAHSRARDRYDKRQAR
jgi:hypothetical protein